MAEIFLKTMDLNFVDRPPNAAGKYTNYNYSGITWSPYGPYWRQARKICLTELFSNRRVESYEHIRVEEMKAFLRETFRTPGHAFVLKDRLFNLSLNVISRMVMGKRFNNVESRNCDNLTIFIGSEYILAGRFLGKDIDVKGQDFTLLPFGSGRRLLNPCLPLYLYEL